MMPPAVINVPVIKYPQRRGGACSTQARHGRQSLYSSFAAITLVIEKAGPAGALFRLSKPGIVLAEVLAGLAGMLLAAAGQPLPADCCRILFAIALAAGGAALVNGIVDADLDRRMPRLAARRRALETVGSGRVLTVALFLMGSGLTLAALTAPLPALLLLAGCLTYLWLYTAWLKRRSPWGVLAGGIPGAIPPLIGAAAVNSSLTAPALLFAVIVYIWQLPHFWLLALDCRDQYDRAGIPVLPLTHGEPLTSALTLATALLLLPLTLTLGLLGSLSFVYLLLAGGAGIIFPLFCARCLYQTHAYRQGFIASLVYLLFIIAAVIAGTFL